MGVAPPPPLRNIPHLTPGASPTTAQLFGQSPQPAPSPTTGHRHSVPTVQFPTKISVLPSSGGPRRDSLTVPPKTHYATIVRPARRQTLPAALEPQVLRITLPNNKVVCNARDSNSDTLLMSVPTPKNNILFSDSARVEGSTPQVTESDSTSQSVEERLLSDGEVDIAQPSSEGAVVSSVGPSINGHKAPATSSSSLAIGNGPKNDSVFTRMRPPRAPSQLLRRNFAQRSPSSSSQSSDSESDVSTDNSETEERDIFDASMLSLTIPSTCLSIEFSLFKNRCCFAAKRSTDNQRAK